MPQAYDLQKIRILLNEGFIAEELIDFCRIVPEFQPLYEQQLNTLSDTEFIDRLVMHARQVSQLEKLLTWAKKRNPIQYTAYEPYVNDGIPTDVEAQVKAVAQQVPLTGTETGLSTQTTTTDSALVDENSTQVFIKEVGGDIKNTTIAGRDVERTNFGQVIQNVFRGSKRRSPSQRNRKAILKRVRSFWVDGVLEKSLHGLAMIELGLANKAEAVDDPLNLTLKTTNQPDRLFPEGTQINDIFKEMNRALLILGEPGSGKTMSLLALARDTIAEAEVNPTKPIPVVFNLSSWSVSQKPIKVWLVDELKIRYQIPSEISESWINNRELLLLLDGLDEVKSGDREPCVLAINAFGYYYGWRNIVVCSRMTDYEALSIQLKLPGAILLQPLTSQQIDHYIDNASLELVAIRTLLREDPILWELAQSPLTLSIMTLAYHGKSVQDLRGFETVAERRTHLFETYIERMFKRVVRTKQTLYTKEETLNQLTKLAEYMARHNQFIFSVGQIQVSWLHSKNQKRLYAIFSRLLTGLTMGVIGGLLLTTLFMLRILVDFSSFGVLSWVLLLLILALVTSLGFGITGLIIGSLIGLIQINIASEEHITDVRALEWSFSAFLNEIKRVLNTYFPEERPELWPNFSSVTGIKSFQYTIAYAKIFVKMISAFNFGVRYTIADEQIDFKKRGVWQSIKNVFVVGFVGILFGLAYGLILWMFILYLLSLRFIYFLLLMIISEESFGLLLSLLLGISIILFSIIFGLIGGLRSGGLQIIQHFTLRSILWLYGYIPWNYEHFLDYAVECIFLRKAGGGYIFIHRSMLEYFVSIGQEINNCTKRVRSNPKSVEAYQDRANAFYDYGNLFYAIIDYSKIIELTSENVDSYLARGKTYYDSGNLSLAIVDYSKAINLDPHNVSAYYIRAKIYYELGEFSHTIDDCTRAIELDSRKAEWYCTRGRAYFEVGDQLRAIADYTKAMKLDSTNIEVYYALGRFHQEAGDWANAFVNYHKAVQLDTKCNTVSRIQDKLCCESRGLAQLDLDGSLILSIEPTG
ncbi:MAG: tetratricopeptide repeat protein [Anaerolineae bacterium]|nr:tetratricopeptide repeat protein [Anaerolineae bacterium]